MLASAVCVVALAVRPAVAQEPPGGGTIEDERLAATATFDATRWTGPDAVLEFELNRPLQPESERLALFVGDTDVSALLSVAARRVTYRPTALPLPRGEGVAVLYVVGTDDSWRELLRTPLRVLRAGGFERADVIPRLTVNNKGQVAEGHRPEAMRPTRPEFQDFSMNAGIQTVHVARGWQFGTQSNYVGVSNREEALRFAQERNAAPKVDLADYLLTVQRGAASLSAGHIAFGTQRHLLSGFRSRGVGAEFRMGSAAKLTVAGLNGSPVVGWRNPLGLSHGDHRLLGGSFGVELAPARPGLVQIEASALDGSVLPLAGFTQGTVTDAEESRGSAVRIAAALPSQRARLEAGYARTRFTNPFDPTLAGDTHLVAVQPVTRSARYVDATVALVRGARLTPSLPSSLSLTVRHERVDPLYRTVAMTGIRADLLQNAVDLTASIGPASLQFTHARARDNLDRIGTIMSTRTHTIGANAGVPLGGLVRSGAPSWLPMLTAAFMRVHQFADSVPRGGGFPDSFAPDQVSTNRTLAAHATGRIWRVMLQLNRSQQDNRQPGRENADFANTTALLSFGITPVAALDAGIDVSADNAHSRERDQRNATRRVGASLAWRPSGTSTLAGGVVGTRARDEPFTSEHELVELRFEISQRVALFAARPGRAPAQLFVRYGRQLGDQLFIGLPPTQRRSWTLNTGATLSLF